MNMLESIVEFQKQEKFKQECLNSITKKINKLNLIISFVAGFSIGFFGIFIIGLIVAIASMV